MLPNVSFHLEAACRRRQKLIVSSAATALRPSKAAPHFLEIITFQLDAIDRCRRNRYGAARHMFRRGWIIRAARHSGATLDGTPAAADRADDRQIPGFLRICGLTTPMADPLGGEKSS